LDKKNGLTQAYKIGDIFELSKEYSDPLRIKSMQLFVAIRNTVEMGAEDNHHRTYMVIFNHHIGSYMEVNYDNFISLDEHRENQINELLST
jgi:hypothetical protein